MPGAKRSNVPKVGPPLVTVVSRVELDELVRRGSGGYVDNQCHDVVYCGSHMGRALIYTTGLSDKALEERLFRRIQAMDQEEVRDLIALEKRLTPGIVASDPMDAIRLARARDAAFPRLRGLYWWNKVNADEIICNLTGRPCARTTANPGNVKFFENGMTTEDMVEALLNGPVHRHCRNCGYHD
ncbi:hypothetical protein H4R21_002712 [Coemansia helicoidea]|uniref:Uncharacterized protein n=1 Tax=Coemansia helicoidea TaxID=1286919 RepID=A0ACC1L654_9FUNG|nr:hypothetical protein H4R21_002712 [Coemansia helicoidea]